jgi:hypothetical protein
MMKKPGFNPHFEKKNVLPSPKENLDGLEGH